MMEKARKTPLLVWLLALIMIIGLALSWHFVPGFRALGYRCVLVIGKRNHQEWAIEKLKDLGEAGVGGLVVALQDENVLVRESAELALSGMGPSASSAIPALALNLKNEINDKHRRHWNLLTLARIGDESIPFVLPLLKDEDEGVRVAAAYFFVEIEPKSSLPVSDLILALQDEDSLVRHMAALALASIGPSMSEAIIVALKNAMNDGDKIVRKIASEAVARSEKIGR